MAEKKSSVSEDLERTKLEWEIAELKSRVDVQRQVQRKEALYADTQAEALEDARRRNAEWRASQEVNCVYTFDSKVDASSVHHCIETLTTWDRREQLDRDFELVFCSPGGSVLHGFALYDHLMELRRGGRRINVTALGYAASMAGILLQAGDTRRMGANSWILIHEISAMMVGKLSSMMDEVEFAKRLSRQSLVILANRSTLSERQIANRWDRKDWWLDADEALKFGFIDEIRQAPPFPAA